MKKILGIINGAWAMLIEKMAQRLLEGKRLALERGEALESFPGEDYENARIWAKITVMALFLTLLFSTLARLFMAMRAT